MGDFTGEKHLRIKLTAVFITGVIFIVLPFANTLHAQIEQSSRIEIPYESNKFDIDIYPLGHQGILSYKEYFDLDKKEVLWEFVKYDTMLAISWQNKIKIDHNYMYRGYHRMGENFYMLFLKNESSKYVFNVLKLHLASGEIETIEDRFEFQMQVIEFQAMGDILYFVGIIRDNPVVMLYNTIEKRMKVLPGIYQRHSQFAELALDDEYKISNVTLVHKLNGNRYTVSIKSYNEDAELLNNVALKPDPKYNLLTGTLTRLETDDWFVSGTYSKQRTTEFSKGIYIARLQDGKQEMINYYEYADLKNFFSYMKPKRKERVEAKIKKRKDLGKEIRLNYRVLMHEVIPYKDKFVVVGEVYYPEYYTETYAIGNSTRIFAGYKYTHAIVIGFDRKGKLLWDNCFEILDVLSPRLEQLVKVNVTDQNIYLVYNSNNTMKVKVVNGDKVVEAKKTEKIKSLNSNDIIEKKEKIENSGHWYGNYFLAWGTQDIKNLKSNRKVFYVNKVKLQ